MDAERGRAGLDVDRVALGEHLGDVEGEDAVTGTGVFGTMATLPNRIRTVAAVELELVTTMFVTIVVVPVGTV